MKYLFLDESGELGFSTGSSKFMLIALLEVDDIKKLKKTMRTEKKRLYDLGWPRTTEIKGTSLFGSHRNNNVPKQISNDKVTHIERILAKILNSCSAVHYAVIRKSAITLNLRKAPYGIAYNYFAGNVLCKIHGGRIREDITLIVDQRNKETHQHMPFDGYLQTRLIGDCQHEYAFNIKHEESHAWHGLQAVDFISWGLFRFYEHDDKRFKQIIDYKIVIRDSWYA